MYKALSLISGGLDSILATKLILQQGIDVSGINFFTGFTGDHNYYFKRFKNGSHEAKFACDQLGIKLHLVDVSSDFKKVLLNPKYGYGSNLNPCLDCKLFMVMQAKKLLEQYGYDFLITGEVLGQRPKSQRKNTLPIASAITSDLVVRPLSAKLLKPTLPERQGWIKRELLCDFHGRSRKPQIELAQKFGLKVFPQPAGGCALTDPNFCHRLQDLWNHRLHCDYNLNDILLLHTGRHLRIKPNFKIVVGRDEIENNFISSFAGKNILLQTISHAGAVVLIDGNIDTNEINFVASLAAYFSKGRNVAKVKVKIFYSQNAEKIIEVIPLKTENILPEWHV